MSSQIPKPPNAETKHRVMEEEELNKKRRRIEKKPSLDLTSFDQTLFPQILAAAIKIRNPHGRSLIKRSLRSLISLLSKNPSLLLPQSFLSLLPLLLNSKYPSVASLGLEVIGAAAVCSFESNAMIASDDAVVKGLVQALGSEDRLLAEAACNAVMDLATSPFGRERLREAFAVEKLLFLINQMATIPIRNMEKTSRNFSPRENVDYNFPRLVLDAAVFLINSSSGDFLSRVPEELLGKMFPLMKELFRNMQGFTARINCCWDQGYLGSKMYDIASFIFKISMNRALSLNWAPLDVRSSVFGTESAFLNFLIINWEESPRLLRKTFNDLKNKATIFSSFIHSFDPSTTGTVLYSVLQHLISCPPISSDELDIFSFLDEFKGLLGSPLVYGQDIRVLKTLKPALGIGQENVDKEMHFFDDNMVSKFIEFPSDVQKYQEAFQDGYTIALRGMEFRSDKIAAVADSLAILFGQPSVGANIYLSPPGSQGLAHHYDDHCVFVWQLFGQKKWRISSSSVTPLPRLYEPVVPMSGLKNYDCGGSQFLLSQGDILYIPRGFVHEAHTVFDENESLVCPTDFSLHLTLGIEVETPFEWEGFAHIALHCWNEKQKQASSNMTDSRLRKQRAMFVMLLHVAIRLIANENSTFRKACMVAAFPLSSDNLMWKHKATFDSIIEKIDADSSFVEAFKWIQEVVQERNDDSLQWMRWLQHLSQGGDMKEKINFNNLLEIFEDLVLMYTGHIAEAVEEFCHFKSMFCIDAVFEDACQCFKTLLDKYRKIRRQYMNGMLSLHST